MAESRPTSWYDAPRKNCHTEVVQQVNYISTQQSEMRDDWLTYLECYANGNVSGLGRSYATSKYFYAQELEDGEIDVRFNICAAGVDTAISLVSQQPVVPMYLSTDGDFKLIRQADKCSQVLQGQLDRDVQESIKRAALDSVKLGTGFLFEKFDVITGLPGVERVSCFEVFIEHADGLHMRPRSMFRSRIVAKETLKAQFPRFATAIDAAEGVTRTNQNELMLQGFGSSFALPDYVTVYEGWHLRPTAKMKGRHVLVISTATLLDEGYQHDSFPCAVFRYRERDVGYYGSGLIESFLPAQSRIDTLIRRIARAQDLASNIVILNPNGEDSVSPEVITNDLGLVISYNALVGPPQLIKWDGTLDDLQNQVQVEFQRALAVEGLSQEQVNGQGAGKGLDSGVAVRAADDVQSRRLVPYTSRFQTSCLHTAQLYERMNDDCAERDPKFAVVGEGSVERRNFLRTSRWVEVRPPKGDARLTMSQMSALPTTVQGRFAAVMEWVQAGFASRQYAMNLLQFPDLDAYASTELAHLDYARWQIEKLLDGEVPDPDPRQDLKLAMDLAVKSKLKAATMGAEEDILQAFEDFLVYCEELMDQAVAQEATPTASPMDASLQLPIGPKGVVAPGIGMGAAPVG